MSDTPSHKSLTVKVTPQFLEKESSAGETKYIFSYMIEIRNEGSGWVKLMSRRWLIINSEGDEERVEGIGVVGYTPEFKPGDTFTYTSFCKLDTEWGTMEGEYIFIDDGGAEFSVPVNRFYLHSS